MEVRPIAIPTFHVKRRLSLRLTVVFCGLQDIFIGWTFARMYYLAGGATSIKDAKDIKVDEALLNDIVPQRGGGNEPLGTQNTPEGGSS